MTTILIPAAEVPVADSCDVLVCGGGCSGVTAAVAAARHGARVVLLERWPSVGGMATNALVNGWHRSDREKMVIYGLVEESAQRAEKHGWIVRDAHYPHAHETHWFDPEGMRIVWQRMLDEAGVRTICYLNAGEPIMADGRIRGVLCETKAGCKAYLGRIVIDATGDGDVAAKAGLPFDIGRAERWSRAGDDADVYAGEYRRAASAARQAGRPSTKSWRPCANCATRASSRSSTRATCATACGLGHGRFFYWNMCPVAGNPLDEAELSRLTAQAREQIVRYVEFWRQHLPGYEQATIEQTGYCLGIRESRRILGRTTLTAEMVLNAVKHPDAVGHGVWMVDIHDPNGSGYTTHTAQDPRTLLAAGTSYHIPLGMALNDQIPNLAVACRAASTTHEALASFRVQTHLMTLAQGVGTAAALALDAGVEMQQVDIPTLQRTLRADGVYLMDVPEGGSEHSSAIKLSAQKEFD